MCFIYLFIYCLFVCLFVCFTSLIMLAKLLLPAVCLLSLNQDTLNSQPVRITAYYVVSFTRKY